MVAVAFISGTLFLLQQFAGINGVLYFSSLTFQNVGITSGAQASLYVGVTNLAGAQISPISTFHVNYAFFSTVSEAMSLFLNALVL